MQERCIFILLSASYPCAASIGLSQSVWANRPKREMAVADALAFSKASTNGEKRSLSDGSSFQGWFFHSLGLCQRGATLGGFRLVSLFCSLKRRLAQSKNTSPAENQQETRLGAIKTNLPPLAVASVPGRSCRRCVPRSPACRRCPRGGRSPPVVGGSFFRFPPKPQNGMPPKRRKSLPSFLAKERSQTYCLPLEHGLSNLTQAREHDQSSGISKPAPPQQLRLNLLASRTEPFFKQMPGGHEKETASFLVG